MFKLLACSTCIFFLRMEDAVVVSQCTMLSATIISRLFLSNCYISLPPQPTRHDSHWTINSLSLGTIFN